MSFPIVAAYLELLLTLNQRLMMVAAALDFFRFSRKPRCTQSVIHRWRGTHGILRWCGKNREFPNVQGILRVGRCRGSATCGSVLPASTGRVNRVRGLLAAILR